MTPHQGNRLDPSDYLYRFMETALGWSVVLQLQWIFPTPPHRHSLADMASRLSEGPLHRRLVTPAIPFARPYWVRSSWTSTVVIDEIPVAAESVSDWLNADLYSAPLDSESGRSWQLHGTYVADGSFALSLTALHLVTDGKAMVSAALAAITVDPPQPAEVAATPRQGLIADGLDAARQLTGAASGIGKALAAAATQRTSRQHASPLSLTKLPMHERAPNAHHAWATIAVDSSHWRSVAEQYGGTANSLFIAIISGALRRSGYAPLGTPIKVGVPVSQRTVGDDRGNATAGVSVILIDEPIAGGDLSVIRSKCKQAFTTLETGRRPASIHLQPLLQLLPDALLVKVATAGTGIPDTVTSNLGRYPAELATVGDELASSVAFRGIAQHVDPALPYRFGEGLQSWLLEVGETLTFTVVGFDELHFGTSTKLRKLLSEELVNWNVVHQIY